jgi:hypothetical protein
MVMQHCQKRPGCQTGLACGYGQTTLSDYIEVNDPMDS